MLSLNFQWPPRRRAHDFGVQVSGEFPDHGITGVFGPSGAGKTTLLRCIAGLDSVDGRIGFADAVWAEPGHHITTQSRGVGMVFQGPQLFAHLSVRDNVHFGLPYRRRSDIASIDELVTLFGIGSLLDRRPDTLSGGEQQRVAIVRALVAGPRLLLLDEPFTGLDLTRRQELLGFLRTLSHEQRLPMIYVSHDLPEMRLVADSLGVMSNGELSSVMPINDILLSDTFSMREDAGVALDLAVAGYDANTQICQLVFGDDTIAVPTVRAPSAKRMRISVAARDVSISAEPVSRSSVMNQVPVVVERMHVTPDTPHACLQLTAGAFSLLAHVTRQSVHSLGLVVGSRVIAHLKAVAIR